MFQVFNMGIGFCVVSAPEDIHLLNEISKRHGISIQRIGYAAESHEKFLELKPYKLLGKGRAFREL